MLILMLLTAPSHWVTQQRHTHTTRTSASPDQLRSLYFHHLDTVSTECIIRSGISIIRHHLSRSKGQGIGTIIPLFPSSSQIIISTAFDQPHRRKPQSALQGLFQTVQGLHPYITVTSIGIPAGLKLEHRYLASDFRKYRKSVPVYHCKDRIKMH